MADIRTNIKITADDSAARRLGETLDKAFSKKKAKGLTDSFEDSLKIVEKLQKNTQKWNLKEARKDTQEWQKSLLVIERLTRETNLKQARQRKLDTNEEKIILRQKRQEELESKRQEKKAARDVHLHRKELILEERKQQRLSRQEENDRWREETHRYQQRRREYLRRKRGDTEDRKDFYLRDYEQRARKHRSFFAGLMQGVGAADYIPADPGMWRRAAGIFTGRAVRHAATPFLMPGLGGVTQAISGIPVFGPGMAAAVGTAAGTYQQALGYSRAQLGALPFMGSNWGQQVKLGKSEEDRQKTITLQQKQDELKALQHAYNLENNRLRDRQQQLQIAQQANRVQLSADRNVRGQQIDAIRMQRNLQKMTGLTAGDGGIGAFGKAAFAPPDYARTVVKPAERYVAQQKVKVNTIQNQLQDTQKSIDNLQRELATAPERFGVSSGLPSMGMGVPYGIGPMQMMGLFTNFMGARGGTYQGAARGQFEEALAAQTRAGISVSQSGAFGRMVAPGGGATPGQDLATILQNAFVQGLNGSQVSEYLNTLVNLGSRAEKSGVRIDPQAFTRIAGIMTLSGLEGLQAQRVAGGLQEAAMGLSARGVSSPMDVLLSRAAGFNPEEGPESYARAMNKLAGGLKPEMVTSLLQDITKGVGGTNFGPEMQSLMFRRAMGRMGVQIGPEQATGFIQAYQQGGPAGLEDFWNRGEQSGAREALMAEAKKRVGVGAGLTPEAAALETEQIGLGYRAAGFVTSAERNQLKAAIVMVGNFGNGLERLNKIVAQAIEKFDMLLKTLNLGLGSPPGGIPRGKR